MYENDVEELHERARKIFDLYEKGNEKRIPDADSYWTLCRAGYRTLCTAGEDKRKLIDWLIEMGAVDPAPMLKGNTNMDFPYVYLIISGLGRREYRVNAKMNNGCALRVIPYSSVRDIVEGIPPEVGFPCGTMTKRDFTKAFAELLKGE